MKELSGQEWGDIFSQAEALGVGFILLAGGEPLTRMDVLLEAGRHRDLLFPVFTNGTMLTHDYLKLFSSSRNLLPVLSIEGGRMITDARRGAGVHAKLMETMEALKPCRSSVRCIRHCDKRKYKRSDFREVCERALCQRL